MAAFIYKVEIYENGKWSNLDGCVQPLYDAETLDETFDYGKLKISMVRRKERIAIGTPVRLKVTENSLPRDGEVIDTEFVLPKNIHVWKNFTNKSTYFYCMVANSTIIQRSFAMPNGRDFYDHFLDTVEFTKQLEREICDTLTFTNYLERDFENTSKEINYTSLIGDEDPDERLNLEIIKFKSPLQVNTNLELPSIELLHLERTTAEIIALYYEYKLEDSYIKLTKPNGEIKQIPCDGTIQLNQIGTYNITYHLKFKARNVDWGDKEQEWDITYLIAVHENYNKNRKPIYTITDVLNRILEVGITRREGIQPQKYKLDEKVAERYKDVKAPEFHITRSTLYEALLQVGGYIHAIPRLLWNSDENKANIITFDELGGSEEFDLEPKYGHPSGELVGYYNQVGIEEYCGTMDSYVENIINTTDEAMGSIIEPCKTTRCEEGGYEISNKTVIIKTDYPIYRLVSLKMVLPVPVITNPKEVKTHDLTPYVYEQAEYDTLTSYDGAYPYAKKYALKYTQGQENITGLPFVYKSEFNLGDTALANILEKFGFNTQTFKDLIFQVSYIPIVSARVKQMKVYDDFPVDNSLFYNQGANTVESNYYGEHLKGVIAKTGNEVETQTYQIYHFDRLPKCGQIFQGKYISKIEREFNFKYIKTTLTLTPNFNKLADYIGINSNFRLYDISEKQSVNRAINYSDIMYIGNDRENEADKVAYSGTTCKNALKHLLGGVSGCQIARVKVQGYSKNNTPIASNCMLPVLSFSQGNSLAFTFKYKDNYGAGYKAVQQVLEKDDNEYKNSMQLVPYGDMYGELHFLKLSLGKVESAESLVMENNSQLIDFINTSLKMPEYNDSEPFSEINYYEHPLIVRKDSREALSVTLQLHFKANRKSIVIGRLLANNNGLVKNGSFNNAVVFLPHKINMLNPYLDLSKAVYAEVGLNSSDNAWEIADGVAGESKDGIEVSLMDFSSEHKKARINKITCPCDNMKSWAIVDKDTGEYYIGENIDMNSGDTTQPIYFTFTA